MPMTFRAELRAMIRLAVPIVAVQLGQMLMGVVDTIMVGRVSAEAIAAVALGNLYFFGAAIFGMGALMALDPVVAQAVGAGDTVAVARVEIAGILPFYIFGALRQSLQALKRIAPIVGAMIVGNLTNLALNYLWIYGKLGFPAGGVIGSAWATVVSRWVMLALLLAVAWRSLRPQLLPWRRESVDWEPLRRMVVLGAPIGIQYELEYGVFAVVGIMMGWMGTAQLAGHQVALNLASLAFMVPLGVSASAAVLVGHAVGRGDAAEARRAARRKRSTSRTRRSRWGSAPR